MPSLTVQFAWLLLLAIPIACIAWTVTHEEVFREWKEYCDRQCQQRRTILERKFFYLFTCEYCFSHYVTIGMLVFTGFRFLLADWRGYVLAGFSLVWIANCYMSLFAVLRVGLKKQRTDIRLEEQQIEEHAG